MIITDTRLTNGFDQTHPHLLAQMDLNGLGFVMIDDEDLDEDEFFDDEEDDDEFFDDEEDLGDDDLDDDDDFFEDDDDFD